MSYELYTPEPPRFSFKRNLTGEEAEAANAKSIWKKQNGGEIAYGPELFEADCNVFSVDAERTRLVERSLVGHWAIGAVIMKPDRVIVDEFAGMIDPSDLRVNDFVRDHVIPHVRLPEYASSEDLLNTFWEFWMDNDGNGRATAVADFGAPVEGSLFAAAQALDLDNREYLGPYPMHELGTRLLDAGVDPDIDRIEFARQGVEFSKHNPLDDAVVAAHGWLNAGEMLYNMRHLRSYRS